MTKKLEGEITESRHRIAVPTDKSKLIEVVTQILQRNNIIHMEIDGKYIDWEAKE